MRLFQNAGIYPSYFHRFNASTSHALSFRERLQKYLDDRFGALHLLSPVVDGDSNAFFTNGDDPILQAKWAEENGLKLGTVTDEILLTQIESHRTEVFYNLDPVRYPSSFARRLPGCVKNTICWRAAPSHGADFSSYDIVVCNFPSIIESWRKLGLRSEFMTPSYDPVMEIGSDNPDRSLDILFIGGYSRHHTRRAKVLESVARLADSYSIKYCLDQSRLTRLADSPIGFLPGISRHRTPSSIREITSEPVFGLDLYRLMQSSKIVLNGAIDMAGEDRGNMRCFEALGCGALMVTDQGNYPNRFVANENMLTYRSADEAVTLITSALENWERSKKVASNGHNMIKVHYSKAEQWKMFLGLVR